MKSMKPTSLVAESADVPSSSLAAIAALSEAPTSVPTTTETAEADAPDANPDAIPEAAPEVSAGATPVAASQPGAAPTAAPSVRTLLKQFQQQFPAFRNCLPLAIGIDKQILARLPGLDRKAMRAALGIHTGSLRYLRAMEKATVRFDLDGTAGAEVTDTHRAHAKEVLQQRFKKEAERKKAERDAAQLEEANRQRQEKLQLLANKFSRNA